MDWRWQREARRTLAWPLDSWLHGTWKINSLWRRWEKCLRRTSLFQRWGSDTEKFQEEIEDRLGQNGHVQRSVGESSHDRGWGCWGPLEWLRQREVYIMGWACCPPRGGGFISVCLGPQSCPVSQGSCFPSDIRRVCFVCIWVLAILQTHSGFSHLWTPPTVLLHVRCPIV